MNHQAPNGKLPASGFTLIELVISAALMAMILTASYLLLSAALSGQKLLEPRAEVLQSARVAMALISADLRAACPLSKDFEFLGMHRMIEDIEADNLDFATHNYKPLRPGQADYCQMSYYVEKDGASDDVSLYRRRNPLIALDALSGGSRELIASGLRGVGFEYSDGWYWYDTWGEINPQRKEKKELPVTANLSGMPEAVRVTLRFNPDRNTTKGRSRASQATGRKPETDNEAPPMVFETTVRLNLAAASQSGFSRNSANQNADDTGPAAPAGNGGQIR